MSTRLREWTVLSMLKWGTEYFEEQKIPDPRLSIEWLLAETLRVNRLDLYLKFDRPLSQAELDTLRPLVKRRANHEPLQYIIGFTDFLNTRITVTPDVLIPRIETEQLAENILDNHEASTSLSVLDIGTGSGCIPIALKKERPRWEITAFDISGDALNVARQNAKANDTDVTFLRRDIFDREHWDFDHSFDLIVSNPPYVLPGEKEMLQKQVTAYEPPLALFCEDLEKMYGTIIAFSQVHLRPGGILYLEIHEHYSETIVSLFEASAWKISLEKDYEKKPRFVVAHKRK